MKKHAYLIMAHNEFHTLENLLKALDDERNDIYIHIDKKAGNVDTDMLRGAVHRSGLFFIKRRKIYWGTLSIVKCELDLLSSATKEEYHYYHLISGVDFPLKSQDYIHDFLENEDGEYISCHTQGEEGYDFMYKLRRFYPLLRFVGKDGKRFGYRQTRLNEFQDRHGIDRTAKYRDITWYKGDQWFSITHDFAVYLLSRRKDIMKMFYLTNGPDEMFVQTIAMNSEFAERVKNDSLRKIDWRRGSPYEFTYNDLEELKGAKELFARKLSYEKEPELLKAVLDHWGRK